MPEEDDLAEWLQIMVLGDTWSGNEIDTGGWWINRSSIVRWSRRTAAAAVQTGFYRAGDDGCWDLRRIGPPDHSVQTLKTRIADLFTLQCRVSTVLERAFANGFPPAAVAASPNQEMHSQVVPNAFPIHLYLEIKKLSEITIKKELNSLMTHLQKASKNNQREEEGHEGGEEHEECNEGEEEQQE
jgi:hypothetical protein